MVLQKKQSWCTKYCFCAIVFNSGTWCVYGGQLPLSVTDNIGFTLTMFFSRKFETKRNLLWDLWQHIVPLYKSKPDYCDYCGKFSLCGCSLLLTDKLTLPSFTEKSKHMNSIELLKFNYSDKVALNNEVIKKFGEFKDEIIFFITSEKPTPNTHYRLKTCFPLYLIAMKNSLFLTEQGISGAGIICQLKQKTVSIYHFDTSRVILQIILVGAISKPILHLALRSITLFIQI